MPPSLSPQAAAQRLHLVHKGASPLASSDILPADRAAAYAIQDATLALLGPVGGWKVGAKSPQTEPNCSPLPRSALLSSGVILSGSSWRMRGIEVEVAVRLARDLPVLEGPLDAARLAAAIDAVLPVIEVVETRLADWDVSDPLAQLADLQSHGALVLGQPAAVRPQDLDLRTLEASLTFDGKPVAHTRGGNTAQDIWYLLGWLATHCAQRGCPLLAGQIVTTGSCTGMLVAPDGTHVRAQLEGIGDVELRFYKPKILAD